MAIRNEQFYQKILEKQLNGKHMYLRTGITDITNDKFHAEIKCWSNWQDSLKQLLVYNFAERRNELRAYFFGEAKNGLKKLAFECLTNYNIEVYVIFDIENNDDKVDLHKMTENDIVEETELPVSTSMGGTHKCPRCGYSTINICDFKNHITRKNICKPKVADIKLDDTIKKYFTPVNNSNECPKCLKKFSTPYSMKRHLKKCNDKVEAPVIPESTQIANLQQEMR